MKKIYSFFLIATMMVLLKIYFSFQEASTSLGNEQAKIARAAATPALSLSSIADQQSTKTIQARSPASIGKWKSLAAAFRHLKKIESCLELACAYPDNDPRQYGLAVAQHLAGELVSLSSFLELQSLAVYDQYLPLILHYAQFEDGYVQEAALHLLSRTSPSAESLEVLNRIFIDCRNPHIAKQVMSEWLKYRDQYDSWQTIKKTIFSQLFYGSITTKSAMVDQLRPYVTTEDRETLIQLQKQFPVGTPIYLSLGSILERLHG